MALGSWSPAAHLCSYPALSGQQGHSSGTVKMIGQPGDWLSCGPKSIMSLLDKVKVEMDLGPLGQGSPVQQQVSVRDDEGRGHMGRTGQRLGRPQAKDAKGCSMTRK